MSARRFSWQEGAVGLAVAYALATGVILAKGGVIHSDELMHFGVVNKATLVGAIADSWNQTHPPLYLALLRGLLALTDDIVVWRGVGVVANVVASLYLFAWLGRLAGRTCALFGTVLFLTAPSTLWLSAQVRGYSLFLMFTCAWLHYLERALAEGSKRRAVAAAAAWTLAAATHYGIVLPTAGGIVAVIVAWRRGASSPRAVRQLALAHALPILALAAYVAFHVPHIERMQTYRSEYLAPLFPAPGETLPAFSWRAIRLAFSGFADRSPAILTATPDWLGDSLLVLCLAGAASYAWARRAAVLPLLAPLVAGALSGALHLYPFGGARHAIGVFPAALALVACGASILPRRARRLVCGALLVFAGVWAWSSTLLRPEYRRFLDRAAEEAFAAEVRRTLPPEADVYLAFEDEFYFRYLVLDPRASLDADVSLRSVPSRAPLGPYHVLSRGWGRSATLCRELATARRLLGEPRRSFWLVALAHDVLPESAAAPALARHGDGRRSLLRFETGPELDAYLAQCPPP